MNVYVYVCGCVEMDMDSSPSKPAQRPCGCYPSLAAEEASVSDGVVGACSCWASLHGAQVSLEGEARDAFAVMPSVGSLRSGFL